MKKGLEGKAVVVVGAGTRGEGIGNGKAAAILYAREGANVLCVDRDEAAAAATRDAIRNESGRAELFVADVSQSKDCELTIEKCMECFSKLDVLHNNVGIGDGREIVDCTEEEKTRLTQVRRGHREVVLPKKRAA